MKVICLHGPESTGKSTLAARLGAHFNCEVVPEYGRTYCEVHGNDLTMADLVHIAVEQDRLTQTALARAARARAGKAGAWLILDTDPLMTAVWADMLFGQRDPWFDAFAHVADLYLLPDIDLPWVDDGLRVYGSAADRARFMDLSVAELERQSVPWAKVSGVGDARWEGVLRALG